MARSRQEIEARRDIVAASLDIGLTMAYDDAEKATRGMSPSSAFSLANRMLAGESHCLAVAKAVRWQRVLDRDYPVK